MRYWPSIQCFLGHSVTAWLIDRFVSKANVTVYELIRGHSYRGKLRQFDGEPLMCYAADTTKRKGDARWRQGVFLGKSVAHDMCLVHFKGNVRLTRSVKSTQGLE